MKKKKGKKEIRRGPIFKIVPGIRDDIHRVMQINMDFACIASPPHRMTLARKKIIAERKRIDRGLKSWVDRCSILPEKCGHPAAEKQWLACFCPDCGKRWTEKK